MPKWSLTYYTERQSTFSLMNVNIHDIHLLQQSCHPGSLLTHFFSSDINFYVVNCPLLMIQTDLNYA